MLTFCDSAPPSPHQGHEASTIDQPVLVAVACFPDRGHAIEELARTNEEFRLLGADLVDAEVAAVRRERSSSALSEVRSAEYWDLVNDVETELEATIDRYL